MSDLQNQTPADTYKGLLQVGDYTNGVDGNSEYIEDGEGTPSALSISTSKVGVGTVSPSAELDVSGNVVADEYALDQTGSSTSAVAIHAPATNELAIRTNSSEQVRIDSSGQCGIGVTNPDAKLHVKGSNGTTFDHINTINLEGTDAYNSGNAGSGINLVGKIDSSGTSTALGQISAIKENTVDGDYKGALTFGARDGSTLNLEAMRIDSSGNVGINTASPAAPLEVSSTTGGVIIPRMTDTQRDAISSPTDGEMIYNTSTNQFQGRANGAWVDFH